MAAGLRYGATDSVCSSRFVFVWCPSLLPLRVATALHCHELCVSSPPLLSTQAILHRIQTREPHYNHVKWEEDRLASEKYLRNICEYPVGEDAARRGPAGAGKLASGVLSPDDLDPEYARESRERLAAATEGFGEDDYPTVGSRPGTLAPLRG